jgi:hypothetical protein
MKELKCREGPEAKERFEQAMRAIFQAPKAKKSKKRTATFRKTKPSDKD